jgi:hypothetical protein
LEGNISVRAPLLLAVAACWLGLIGPAGAQFKEDTPPSAKPGEITTQRWRIGMIITAEGSAFNKIVGTTTVVMDWPDQQIRPIEEDLSPGVTISPQNFEGAARQMVVKVASLGANEEAKAILTFEVRRLLPPPPDATDGFTLPKPENLERRMAVFLAPSPYMESNHPEVKKLAEQIAGKKEKAWDKAEAIYDWVREHVEFRDNRHEEPKGTLQTLNDGNGDCDEMTSVFVAICRAAGIPARMVRVPGHVYPEFYLMDPQGKGHWFPCQAAGSRAFGGITDGRPILQKGDNLLALNPKTNKKTRFRILPDNLTGLPVVQSGRLKLKLVCEPVL